MRVARSPLLLFLVAHISCTCDRGPQSGALAAPKPGTLAEEIAVHGRSAMLVAPDREAHRGATPHAALLLLHGYGGSGRDLLVGSGMSELVRGERLLIVAPEGTKDSVGHRFWNATDACCNFDKRTVDDVGYLRTLLQEIAKRRPLDWNRVYVLGFSNGAFMANRLACESAPKIAAVVSVAGGAPLAPSACRPAAPVSVLLVHGDGDDIVRYGGGASILGRGGAAYPGALETARTWAKHDRCKSPLQAGSSLDLVPELPGAETAVQSFSQCPDSVDVRLWTVRGAGHQVPFSPEFTRQVWAWLKAHPRAAGRTRYPRP